MKFEFIYQEEVMNIRRPNPDHLRCVMDMINSSPYYSLLGMRMVELDNGYARMEMDVDRQRHMNPFGSVHGGAYASMIDCATYWAAYSDQDENAGFTTLDIAVTNLSMCRGGKLTVNARAIKEGRSVCLCEARITDESGKIVSYGTSKLLILQGRQSISDAMRSLGYTELPPKFLD